MYIISIAEVRCYCLLLRDELCERMDKVTVIIFYVLIVVSIKPNSQIDLMHKLRTIAKRKYSFCEVTQPNGQQSIFKTG